MTIDPPSYNHLRPLQAVLHAISNVMTLPVPPLTNIAPTTCVLSSSGHIAPSTTSMQPADDDWEGIGIHALDAEDAEDDENL